MRGDFRSEAMEYRDLDLAAQRRAEEEMMSESKALPVLWTVGQTTVLGMGPWVVYADAEVIATTRREADARLLAAAPDLLAALKAALPWMGKALADGAFDACAGKRLAPVALTAMEAAIARATGEEVPHA